MISHCFIRTKFLKPFNKQNEAEHLLNGFKNFVKNFITRVLDIFERKEDYHHSA